MSGKRDKEDEGDGELDRGKCAKQEAAERDKKRD